MNKISTLFITLGIGALSTLNISAQNRQSVRVAMPDTDTVIVDNAATTKHYGEQLGIKGYDSLPPNALLPITRAQAEELITKMIVVSRAPAVQARRRAEIVNDFKVEQLKKRLLEQALRQTYADEYQQRLDRLENLLIMLIASGHNKIDPKAVNMLLAGETPESSNTAVTTLTPAAKSMPMRQNLTDGETIAMIPGATAPSWEHFLSQVFFGFDSSKLTNDAMIVLDNVVGWLAENNGMELSLRGYASPEGNMSYNNKLSARRVNAVADYLISKGVSKSRLHTIPSGMDTMKDKKAVYPDARRVDVRPYYGE